jgi:hypothetical protein
MCNEFLWSSSPWALVADNAVVLDPESNDVLWEYGGGGASVNL